MKLLGSSTKHTRPPQGAKGYSALVHYALILTGKLGEISPFLLLPAWVALVAIASWPWPTSRRPLVMALSALFLIGDWIALALLPLRKRSWGPVVPPLLALTLARVGGAWMIAWVWPTLAGLGLLIGLDIALSAVVLYSTWIEPFNLHVTHQTLRLQSGTVSRPLRVLHISDLHFEGYSPRERDLLRAASQLSPDLILLTGDYLNLSSVYDATAQAGVRDEVLAHLSAPLGVYAVTGSPVVDVEGIVPDIFDSLSIHWLQDEVRVLEWEGQRLALIGLRCTYDQIDDAERLARLVRAHLPDGVPSILLYHTPDLMPDAARLGITLYLAGHTHGGQIRAPLYGAIVTSSSWGKRYEMGRYQEGDTTLYVNRGLGMEGLGAPRARFLAPPEIVLWNL